MIRRIINWWRKKTHIVTWGEVRQEILRSCEDMKVKFEITPYYYKVTSGKKTWHWCKDTGEFDGTSWDMS